LPRSTSPRRRRFDDHDDDYDFPETGDRWSTYADTERGLRGPEPVPAWLVTSPGAVDHERGVLKTGKEADVFLVERAVPDRDGCLLAAKRYRDSEHRAFHRDAGYLEGRRVRRSRENRAMANRTAFGRDLIAHQWAAAEFAMLGMLWRHGVPVPYPVSVAGREVLLEFLGEPDGTAAPRLAQVRPEAPLLGSLWGQCVAVTVALARLGYAHADLSPYNLLVHGERLVLIDLPQAVDVVANPRGEEFLRRDAANVGRWFAARGVDGTGGLGDLLVAEAGLAR
jgi:RIO kinase 1